LGEGPIEERDEKALVPEKKVLFSGQGALSSPC
jgi:hypothetical protein